MTSVLTCILSPLFKFRIKNLEYASKYLLVRSSSKFSFPTMTTDKKIFVGKLDRFKGITVHSDKEECSSLNEFQEKLEESLKVWNDSGNRGIWFNVHLKHAEWVPVLAKKGFKYHHALEEYVMMYLWLPSNENCNIPRYAHTMIGVGAVVVNDKNQILVVREKYSIVGSQFWKLPGGYVEPGENLIDGAIREVQEETNISTEFHSILTILNAHGGQYNCSHIYIVISLRPLNENISKCDREIAECKWMSIKEYLDHKNTDELNKFHLQKYLEHKKHCVKIGCYHGVHSLVKKPYTLYSVTKDKKVMDKENNTEIKNNSRKL